MGPTDMERFLTFLGLPIPTSFAAETFSKIENLIGDSLLKVARESMKEGLLEEMQAQRNKENMEMALTQEKIGISASYDMGWSKRSSGNRYDSLSGHAFLISCLCRKIISAQVTSKKCSTCAKYNASEDDPPPPHKCTLKKTNVKIKL